MKGLIAFVLILLSIQVSAQINPNDLVELKRYVNSLPPSPSVAQLTKIAGTTIDYSSGAVSERISIENISQHGLSLDVSLDYNSGNGIKINEFAGKTGYGWNLTAGGVISRVIHDKPDEKSPWVNIPAPTGTANYLTTLNAATVPNVDTELDIFSFNFLNHSGRFVIDPNNKTTIHFLEASNLSVSFNFQVGPAKPWTFLIKDEHGTAYYFGGAAATERTRTQTYIGGSAEANRFAEFEETAWHLTKIEDRRGNQINLGYVANLVHHYSGATETMIRTPLNTTASAACPGQNCPNRSSASTVLSGYISEGLVLKSISSTFKTLTFGYAGRADISGDSLLTRINIYQSDLVSPATKHLRYRYDLEYVLAKTGSAGISHHPVSSSFGKIRPFLSKLLKISSSDTDVHIFRYHDINKIPPILSFAQDFWGYANANSSQHMIPDFQYTVAGGLFQNLNLANRRPVDGLAKYGLLSSITYPTGGVDSILYEQNTAYYAIPDVVSRSYVRQQQGIGVRTERASNTTIDMGAAQTASVSLQVSHSGTGVNDMIHQHAIVNIWQGNALLYSRQVQIGGNNQGTVVLNANCRIELLVYGEAALANLSVNYVQHTTVLANHLVGGVRVAEKQLIGFGKIQRKIYDYSKSGSPLQSSGIINRSITGDLYFLTKGELQNCQGHIAVCNVVQASSNPSYDIFMEGKPVSYTTVKEISLDGQSRSAVEYGFSAAPQLIGTLVHGQVYTNFPNENYTRVKNGSKLKEIFYEVKAVGNSFTFIPLKEVRYNHKVDLRKSTMFTSWQLNKKVDLMGNLDERQFDLVRYAVGMTWVYVDSIITTSFYPMGNVLDKTVYAYDNLHNFLPTKVSSESSDQKTEVYEIMYPHDLLTEYSYAAPLIAEGQISRPLFVKKSRGGQTVLEIKNVFTAFHGRYELREKLFKYLDLPEFQTDQILDYSVSGNLISQKNRSLAERAYLYGYDGQFVKAEITNARASEVFYEDFEQIASATENISLAHSGRRYHSGNYSVPFAVGTAVPYRISYYYYSGSKWHHMDKAYAGPSVLTDGAMFDDIVVYPQRSMVSTYTYDTFGNVTSSTVGNQLLKFRYDDFSRLKSEIDIEGNLLKNYRYNLIGGQEVIYFNDVQSQTFNKECVVGQGSAVTYTVPAGTYASLVSKAAANALAVEDLGAHGQQYANINGLCGAVNITTSYANQTVNNSGKITSVELRDQNNVLQYTFSEAQLAAGAIFPAGVYNLRFTTSGPLPTGQPTFSQLGWRTILLQTNQTEYLVSNTGVNSYTLNNVDCQHNFSLKIYNMPQIE